MKGRPFTTTTQQTGCVKETAQRGEQPEDNSTQQLRQGQKATAHLPLSTNVSAAPHRPLSSRRFFVVRIDALRGRQIIAGGPDAYLFVLLRIGGRQRTTPFATVCTSTNTITAATAATYGAASPAHGRNIGAISLAAQHAPPPATPSSVRSGGVVRPRTVLPRAEEGFQRRGLTASGGPLSPSASPQQRFRTAAPTPSWSLSDSPIFFYWDGRSAMPDVEFVVYARAAAVVNSQRQTIQARAAAVASLLEDTDESEGSDKDSTSGRSDTSMTSISSSSSSSSSPCMDITGAERKSLAKASNRGAFGVTSRRPRPLGALEEAAWPASREERRRQKRKISSSKHYRSLTPANTTGKREKGERAADAASVVDPVAAQPVQPSPSDQVVGYARVRLDATMLDRASKLLVRSSKGHRGAEGSAPAGGGAAGSASLSLRKETPPATTALEGPSYTTVQLGIRNERDAALLRLFGTLGSLQFFLTAAPLSTVQRRVEVSTNGLSPGPHSTPLPAPNIDAATEEERAVRRVAGGQTTVEAYINHQEEELRAVLDRVTAQGALTRSLQRLLYPAPTARDVTSPQLRKKNNPSASLRADSPSQQQLHPLEPQTDASDTHVPPSGASPCTALPWAAAGGCTLVQATFHPLDPILDLHDVRSYLEARKEAELAQAVRNLEILRRVRQLDPSSRAEWWAAKKRKIVRQFREGDAAAAPSRPSHPASKTQPRERRERHRAGDRRGATKTTTAKGNASDVEDEAEGGEEDEDSVVPPVTVDTLLEKRGGRLNRLLWSGYTAVALQLRTLPSIAGVPDRVWPSSTFTRSLRGADPAQAVLWGLQQRRKWAYAQSLERWAQAQVGGLTDEAALHGVKNCGASDPASFDASLLTSDTHATSATSASEETEESGSVASATEVDGSGAGEAATPTASAVGDYRDCGERYGAAAHSAVSVSGDAPDALAQTVQAVSTHRPTTEEKKLCPDNDWSRPQRPGSRPGTPAAERGRRSGGSALPQAPADANGFLWDQLRMHLDEQDLLSMHVTVHISSAPLPPLSVVLPARLAMAAASSSSLSPSPSLTAMPEQHSSRNLGAANTSSCTDEAAANTDVMRLQLPPSSGGAARQKAEPVSSSTPSAPLPSVDAYAGYPTESLCFCRMNGASVVQQLALLQEQHQNEPSWVNAPSLSLSNGASTPNDKADGPAGDSSMMVPLFFPCYAASSSGATEAPTLSPTACGGQRVHGNAFGDAADGDGELCGWLRVVLCLSPGFSFERLRALQEEQDARTQRQARGTGATLTSPPAALPSGTTDDCASHLSLFSPDITKRYATTKAEASAQGANTTVSELRDPNMQAYHAAHRQGTTHDSFVFPEAPVVDDGQPPIPMPPELMSGIPAASASTAVAGLAAVPRSEQGDAELRGHAYKGGPANTNFNSSHAAHTDHDLATMTWAAAAAAASTASAAGPTPWSTEPTRGGTASTAVHSNTLTKGVERDVLLLSMPMAPVGGLVLRVDQVLSTSPAAKHKAAAAVSAGGGLVDGRSYYAVLSFPSSNKVRGAAAAAATAQPLPSALLFQALSSPAVCLGQVDAMHADLDASGGTLPTWQRRNRRCRHDNETSSFRDAERGACAVGETAAHWHNATYILESCGPYLGLPLRVDIVEAPTTAVASETTSTPSKTSSQTQSAAEPAQAAGTSEAQIDMAADAPRLIGSFVFHYSTLPFVGRHRFPLVPPLPFSSLLPPLSDNSASAARAVAGVGDGGMRTQHGMSGTRDQRAAEEPPMTVTLAWIISPEMQQRCLWARLHRLHRETLVPYAVSEEGVKWVFDGVPHCGVPSSMTAHISSNSSLPSGRKGGEDADNNSNAIAVSTSGVDVNREDRELGNGAAVPVTQMQGRLDDSKLRAPFLSTTPPHVSAAGVVDRHRRDLPQRQWAPVDVAEKAAPLNAHGAETPSPWPSYPLVDVLQVPKQSPTRAPLPLPSQHEGGRRSSTALTTMPFECDTERFDIGDTVFERETPGSSRVRQSKHGDTMQSPVTPHTAAPLTRPQDEAERGGRGGGGDHRPRRQIQFQQTSVVNSRAGPAGWRHQQGGRGGRDRDASPFFSSLRLRVVVLSLQNLRAPGSSLSASASLTPYVLVRYQGSTKDNYSLSLPAVCVGGSVKSRMSRVSEGGGGTLVYFTAEFDVPSALLSQPCHVITLEVRDVLSRHIFGVAHVPLQLPPASTLSQKALLQKERKKLSERSASRQDMGGANSVVVGQLDESATPLEVGRIDAAKEGQSFVSESAARGVLNATVTHVVPVCRPIVGQGSDGWLPASLGGSDVVAQKPQSCSSLPAQTFLNTVASVVGEATVLTTLIPRPSLEHFLVTHPMYIHLTVLGARGLPHRQGHVEETQSRFGAAGLECYQGQATISGEAPDAYVVVTVRRCESALYSSDESNEDTSSSNSSCGSDEKTQGNRDCGDVFNADARHEGVWSTREYRSLTIPHHRCPLWYLELPPILCNHPDDTYTFTVYQADNDGFDLCMGECRTTATALYQRMRGRLDGDGFEAPFGNIISTPQSLQVSLGARVDATRRTTSERTDVTCGDGHRGTLMLEWSCLPATPMTTTTPPASSQHIQGRSRLTSRLRSISTAVAYSSAVMVEVQLDAATALALEIAGAAWARMRGGSGTCSSFSSNELPTVVAAISLAQEGEDCGSGAGCVSLMAPASTPGDERGMRHGIDTASDGSFDAAHKRASGSEYSSLYKLVAGTLQLGSAVVHGRRRLHSWEAGEACDGRDRLCEGSIEHHRHPSSHHKLRQNSVLGGVVLVSMNAQFPSSVVLAFPSRHPLSPIHVEVWLRIPSSAATSSSHTTTASTDLHPKALRPSDVFVGETTVHVASLTPCTSPLQEPTSLTTLLRPRRDLRYRQADISRANTFAAGLGTLSLRAGVYPIGVYEARQRHRAQQRGWRAQLMIAIQDATDFEASGAYAVEVQCLGIGERRRTRVLRDRNPRFRETFEFSLFAATEMVEVRLLELPMNRQRFPRTEERVPDHTEEDEEALEPCVVAAASFAVEANEVNAGEGRDAGERVTDGARDALRCPSMPPMVHATWLTLQPTTTTSAQGMQRTTAERFVSRAGVAPKLLLRWRVSVCTTAATAAERHATELTAQRRGRSGEDVRGYAVASPASASSLYPSPPPRSAISHRLEQNHPQGTRWPAVDGAQPPGDTCPGVSSDSVAPHVEPPSYGSSSTAGAGSVALPSFSRGVKQDRAVSSHALFASPPLRKEELHLRLRKQVQHASAHPFSLTSAQLQQPLVLNVLWCTGELVSFLGTGSSTAHDVIGFCAAHCRRTAKQDGQPRWEAESEERLGLRVMSLGRAGDGDEKESVEEGDLRSASGNSSTSWLPFDAPLLCFLHNGDYVQACWMNSEGDRGAQEYLHPPTLANLSGEEVDDGVSVLRDTAPTDTEACLSDARGDRDQEQAPGRFTSQTFATSPQNVSQLPIIVTGWLSGAPPHMSRSRVKPVRQQRPLLWLTDRRALARVNTHVLKRFELSARLALINACHSAEPEETEGAVLAFHSRSSQDSLSAPGLEEKEAAAVALSNPQFCPPSSPVRGVLATFLYASVTDRVVQEVVQWVQTHNNVISGFCRPVVTPVPHVFHVMERVFGVEGEGEAHKASDPLPCSVSSRETAPAVTLVSAAEVYVQGTAGALYAMLCFLGRCRIAPQGASALNLLPSSTPPNPAEAPQARKEDRASSSTRPRSHQPSNVTSTSSSQSLTFHTVSASDAYGLDVNIASSSATLSPLVFVEEVVGYVPVLQRGVFQLAANSWEARQVWLRTASASCAASAKQCLNAEESAQQRGRRGEEDGARDATCLQVPFYVFPVPEADVVDGAQKGEMTPGLCVMDLRQCHREH